MTDDELSAMVNGTVTDLTAKLPDLTDDDLARLLAAEKGRGDGDARVTAVRAIETEQARRAAPPTSGGEAPAADPPAPAPVTVVKGGEVADAAALDPGDVSAAPQPAKVEQLRTFDAAALKGQPLLTLEAMRVLEVAGDDRPEALDAIDAEIERLREEAKKLPEIDPSKTIDRIVPTRAALDAIKGGRTELFFVDGQRRLEEIPSINLSEAMFSVQGGAPVLDRDVTIAGSVGFARVTHAVLADADGALAGLCEIPDGISVGNGREAKFPAGSLRF